MKNSTIGFLVVMLLSGVSVYAATVKKCWLLLANRTNKNISVAQKFRGDALFDLSPGDVHCMIISDPKTVGDFIGSEVGYPLYVRLEDDFTGRESNKLRYVPVPSDEGMGIVGLVFCNERNSSSLVVSDNIEDHLFNEKKCAELLAQNTVAQLSSSGPQDYGFDRDCIDDESAADSSINQHLMRIFIGMEKCFAYDETAEASYCIAPPGADDRRIPLPPSPVVPDDACKDVVSSDGTIVLTSPRSDVTKSADDAGGHDYEVISGDEDDWTAIDADGEVVVIDDPDAM